MNELYFCVDNSPWRSETASACRFDELIEFLTMNKNEEWHDAFMRDVAKQLDIVYQTEYAQIDKPETEDVADCFKLTIPGHILSAALPALQWYMRNEHSHEYKQTAADIMQAFEEAESKRSTVFIWGE